MKIKFKIPQRWNDLSEYQIRMIGRFMFNSRNEQVETKLFKVAILSILVVPKPTLKNIVKAVFLWSQVPFSELEQYTAFIFDKKELLTRFPDKIKIGRWPFRTSIYGPAPRMANVTIEELSYADTFYYKWSLENNPDDLHRLTAILYRPKAAAPSLDDIRKPFSTLCLESNANVTDAIPLPLKFMIAHAYAGCRQNFINRNPNVFPQPRKVEEELEPQPLKKLKAYQPFSKIIDSMAMDEIQVFGNHQQTEKVYASKFLAVLDESIIRNKEKERQNSIK